MDEETWQKALQAHPHCGQTLAAWIDWLTERGDPRAEPYGLLYDHYGVGFPDNGAWYEAVYGIVKYHPKPVWTYHIRMAFVHVWLQVQESSRHDFLASLPGRKV